MSGQPARQWGQNPRCRCGRGMTMGSRSCRDCFLAGRGAKAGRRGPSLLTVLKEVRKMAPDKNGEVRLHGLVFKKVQ